MNQVSSEQLVYLIGAQSAYSREVLAIVLEGDFGNPVLVDNLNSGVSTDLGGIGSTSLATAEGLFLLCPSPPGARHTIEQSLRSPEMKPSPAIVHPSASVDSTASLGLGTTINRLVAIAHNAVLGRHCQVNRMASIGHETAIADFVTLGPGSILTGKITVHTGAFIGAGAVVLPGVTIGSNSVVGAGAIVVNDVAPLSTVAGNPSREIRRSSCGYGGYTVPWGNQ